MPGRHGIASGSLRPWRDWRARTGTLTDKLHRRARLIRERELIRAWEYRQRGHAKGVWYRLRRALVDAAEAWVIDDRDADRLAVLGRVELPVGGELNPPKRIFFVTEHELAAAPSRRSITVRMSAELLQARNLALIAFDGSRSSPTPRAESARER